MGPIRVIRVFYDSSLTLITLTVSSIVSSIVSSLCIVYSIVSQEIDHRPVCFITAHLAAHQDKVVYMIVYSIVYRDDSIVSMHCLYYRLCTVYSSVYSAPPRVFHHQNKVVYRIVYTIVYESSMILITMNLY